MGIKAQFQRFFKFLVRADKDVNHEVLNGNENETISSRMGRKIKDKNCMWCRFFCRFVLLPLGFILWIVGKQDKPWRHCVESIQEEFLDKNDKGTT